MITCWHCGSWVSINSDACRVCGCEVDANPDSDPSPVWLERQEEREKADEESE